MVVLPCTQINLPEMTWTWTLQAVYRNVQLIVFCVHCTHAAPYFLSKGFEIMYGDGEVEYKCSLYTDKLDKWWTEHMSRRNLYTRSFMCTSFLQGPHGMENTGESRVVGTIPWGCYTGPNGVLPFIWPKNVCSRTRSVACWCDEHTTGVNCFGFFTWPNGQGIVRVLKSYGARGWVWLRQSINTSMCIMTDK